MIRTYLEPPGYEIVELPYLENGRTDLQTLEGMDDLAAIAVQSPNFFGCIEELAAVGSLTRDDAKTLFVASFTEPLAYGLLKDPRQPGGRYRMRGGSELRNSPELRRTGTWHARLPQGIHAQHAGPPCGENQGPNGKTGSS